MYCSDLYCAEDSGALHYTLSPVNAGKLAAVTRVSVVTLLEYDDTDRDDDGNKIWDDPSVSGGKGGRRRREIMKKVGAYVTVVNMHRTL